MSLHLLQSQRGAVTIFVCMIMLLLITVLSFTAYSLSTMNLKAVDNAQVREEALASANEVIEQVIGSDFTANPVLAAGEFLVDINGDGITNYQVVLAEPECVRAIEVSGDLDSSENTPGLSSSSGWNTVWELDATATEVTTGVNVQVLHGVRVLLNDLEKLAVCPDP